ncbi:MAG: secretin N-terminal domain-containing protein [Candidatus Omnitrophota bacterium]
MKKNIFLLALLIPLLFLNTRALCQQEPAESTDQTEGLISLSFQDVDINQALKVLGDITQTVIIPNEGLQGKINIVSLEKVKPETVVNILESALMIRGYTLVKSAGALKVVPIAETKQTNVAVEIGTAPGIIEEKDIVITQVMPLRNASAIQLKNDLQTLVGKHGNILAHERTNTIIITDLSSNIKRLATIIEQLDKDMPSKMQVKSFTINYGEAVKIAKILIALSNKETASQYQEIQQLGLTDTPVELFGAIEAFGDEETNSIIVATAPRNFPAIENIIAKLDIFPPQAMIEVILMDVTLDDDFTMGVEYGSATAPTVTTEGIKVDLAGVKSDKESIFHSLLGLSTSASSNGFTYRILTQKETSNLLGFILNSQENSKVLSTPRILASNNQESTITVGQEVPIIESSVTDLVNNVTTVNFKYQDVGLQLKVTPRISQDGFVNLKIHAELKDLSAKTLFDASIINKREADATVIIPDGHTVVLGGLMRDNDSIIENKIPFFGDLPFVGHFFKKTEKTMIKTELLVFLTPHVLKSVEDLENISKPSKEKLEAVTNIQRSQLKQGVRKAVDFPPPRKKQDQRQKTIDHRQKK